VRASSPEHSSGLLDHIRQKVKIALEIARMNGPYKLLGKICFIREISPSYLSLHDY
jgi:hypothetical protein